MPKKNATASDLASHIRDTKLAAMRERDRFKKDDELDQLREENARLKTYTRELENLLATTETALIRLAAREAAKGSQMPKGTLPPKPKVARRSAMPKQTAMPMPSPHSGNGTPAP
jgi:hypothetical protein